MNDAAIIAAIATAATIAYIWRQREQDGELEFDFAAFAPNPWDAATADWQTEPVAEPVADNTDQALPWYQSELGKLQDELASYAYTAQAVIGGAGSAGDQQANRRAFLDAIAWAEGTSGPNGYRTLFGGNLFDSFADHPRRSFSFKDRAGRRLTTTAAGRYQFLARTWDTLRDRLSLPDFGPDSQDAAALELIRERGALADVDAGRFAAAVGKVKRVWASLPGAGYAQPERRADELAAAYIAAGGTIA
jgi:lysozyme